MHAIPTTLNNLRFRSRLEAQWSKFFDLLRWPWEYEPFDLDGYIPDFVLKFHRPLLVECKPALYLKDLAPFEAKINDSGWQHEALLVGATLFDRGEFGPVLGLLRDREWGEAVLFQCEGCGMITIRHREFSFDCRVCGLGTGSPNDIVFSTALSLWNRAKSDTQWKGAKP